jgi:hypothetical protein
MTMRGWGSMNVYLGAWRSVMNDLTSRVTVVPVTSKMPNRPPHSVEEALLMFDVLDQQVVRLRSLIYRATKVRRTSLRQIVLLELTREVLRCINFQQMYLNKAANLLKLDGRDPDPKVTGRETFLDYERKVAVEFLEKLKEMRAFTR